MGCESGGKWDSQGRKSPMSKGSGCQTLGFLLDPRDHGRPWRVWNRAYAKSCVWQSFSSSSMETEKEERLAGSSLLKSRRQQQSLELGDQPPRFAQDHPGFSIESHTSSVPGKQAWLVTLAWTKAPDATVLQDLPALRSDPLTSMGFWNTHPIMFFPPPPQVSPWNHLSRIYFH